MQRDRKSPSYWAGKEAVMYVKSRLISAALMISSATVLGSVRRRAGWVLAGSLDDLIGAGEQ
jgi:hypothetical protein